jgi:hypothetical protein
MRRSFERPAYRFHIDHGENNAPPPRRPRNAQQSGPAYWWNGTTQELIEILPEDHPNYRENAETIRAAFRRWERGTSK